MTDYYILITDAGAALESAAHASGTTVALARFGVCDGGVEFTPDPALTTFANEVYSGPISSLAVSTDDPAVLVAQCIIPATSGGYTIRGIALYTSDGTLYATGNYPDQQKPAADSGYSASLEILAQLAVSDTADITLQVVDGSYLTETEADTLYLRQDKNLGEIAAAGTTAQSAARSNLALGTAATADLVESTTDTTTGRVMTVGFRGMGYEKSSVVTDFDFNSYKFATGETLFIQMASAINIPEALTELSNTYCYINVTGVRDGTTNDCSLDVSDYQSTRAFILWRERNDTGAVIWESLDLNQYANYLPLTGGVLTADDAPLILKNKTQGASLYFLARNADNTNRWYIGNGSNDSDDVVIGSYASNTEITLKSDGRISLSAANEDGESIEFLFSGAGDITAPGKMVPGLYDNFDERYIKVTTAIQGVRFSADATLSLAQNGQYDRAVTAPSGGIISMLGDTDTSISPSMDSIDGAYSRYLQVNVNGTWSTAGQLNSIEVSLIAEPVSQDSPVSLFKNLRPYRGKNYPAQLDFVDENGMGWVGNLENVTGSVFIAVDSAGFIKQISNEDGISSLTPFNLSVACLDELLDDVSLDGSWKYDVDTGEFSQDADIVAANVLRKNTATLNSLMRAALAAISVIQCSAAAGSPRDGDSAELLALQQYVDQLRDVDLTALPMALPTLPASLN